MFKPDYTTEHDKTETDRILARLPACRTHLPVLIRVLEGLHQSQGLVHATTHWQVVHRNLPNNTLLVNDEQPSTTKWWSLYIFFKEQYYVLNSLLSLKKPITPNKSWLNTTQYFDIFSCFYKPVVTNWQPVKECNVFIIKEVTQTKLCYKITGPNLS